MATVPVYYFTGRSAGIALGLAVSGAGCGSCVMPVVIEVLIETYGWQGSLLILGGMCLNICVCGALLRPPETKTTTDRKVGMNWKVLRNVNFTLHLVHQVFFTIGLSVVYVHITALIEVLTGASRSQSSVVLIIAGISSFVGRIIHGTIAGIKSVNVVSQYLLSYTILGLSLLVVPSLPYYPVLLVFGGIFGALGSAPYGTLNQIIIIKYAGIENLKFGYGLLLFMCGVGGIVGAPIAGFLYDVTNDYRTSMYFGGASVILCVLIMLKPWMNATCLRPKKLKKIEQSGHDDKGKVDERFIVS
jgi:predicted MFS family arabinose efflux permease